MEKIVDLINSIMYILASIQKDLLSNMMELSTLTIQRDGLSGEIADLRQRRTELEILLTDCETKVKRYYETIQNLQRRITNDEIYAKVPICARKNHPIEIELDKFNQLMDDETNNWASLKARFNDIDSKYNDTLKQLQNIELLLLDKNRQLKKGIEKSRLLSLELLYFCVLIDKS